MAQKPEVLGFKFDACDEAYGLMWAGLIATAHIKNFNGTDYENYVKAIEEKVMFAMVDSLDKCPRCGDVNINCPEWRRKTLNQLHGINK